MKLLSVAIGYSIGERHLQGGYADRDSLLSTLKVLAKRGV